MKRNIYLIILFLSLAGFRNIGTRTISGFVYDQEDRVVLPGVIIGVTGSKTRTFTDSKGHYSITVNEGETKLIVTYVTYDTRMIKIGKSDTLNVQMESNRNTVTILFGLNRNITNPNGTHPFGPVAFYSNGKPGVQISNRNGGVINLPGGLNSAHNNHGIVENSFNDAMTFPLSTFAIDVVTDSYNNIRRDIKRKLLPVKNTVHIEEMINYFHYNLAKPVDTNPVAIHTELSSAPWNPQHHLLKIDIKAKPVKTDQIPRSNLVFLIDVSPSMSDSDKLPYAKQAMKLLADQLRETDHVAIISFNGYSGLRLASTSGNQKTKIKEAIESPVCEKIDPDTEGLKLAYKIAKENFIKNGNNRIIMITDGDPNEVLSSNEDIEKVIANETQNGIGASVLMFGTWSARENRLTSKKNGIYTYVGNIKEARSAILNEFGCTSPIEAEDINMQIEFRRNEVQDYRLIGYENRSGERIDLNDKNTGIDIVDGQVVTALYEIIPSKENANHPGKLATIKFRYKIPDSDQSRVMETPIKNKPLNLMKTSSDFRFASAVAELGLILLDSEFKQQANYDALIDRAKSAKGKDKEGYRTEFINLAESAKLLSKSGQESK